jgi:hypothetical protein
MAKNARLLEMGPANVYLYAKPKAETTLSDVFVQAVLPGADGNDITLEFVEGPSTAPLSVDVDGTAITVTLATTSGASTSTVADVIDALNEDPAAAFLVTAARGAGEDGTTVISADAGPVNLSGGSDTGVATDVGYLGEGVAYQVTTEANPLTGAQKGNVALDKVVVGGMVKVVIPFKEISLDNFKAGIPLTRLVSNSDGSKRRLDFAVTVGLSMRSRAVKMEIRKIKGGFESVLPQDRIIIPEISPAEGEVTFPFAPTTQREIMTNWYAWPDDTTGRWAFTGDENP